MTLKFTPPPNKVRYAVACGKWFHVYDSLGAAKLALRHLWRSDTSFILEFVDDAWFVLFEIPVGTSNDDLPWRSEVTDWAGRPRGWKKARSMSRDEYADWRVRVERERLGVSG